MDDGDGDEEVGPAAEVLGVRHAQVAVVLAGAVVFDGGANRGAVHEGGSLRVMM